MQERVIILSGLIDFIAGFDNIGHPPGSLAHILFEGGIDIVMEGLGV